MKLACIFYLSAAAAFAGPVERAIDIQPRPNTPEEMARNRKESETVMARIPLERRYTNYVRTGPDEIVPAIFDDTAMIEYRWRRVTLHARQIPNLNKDGSAMIPVLVGPSKYAVQYIDPPTRFLPLADGRFAVGYYDHSHGNFFQLKGRTMGKSELPPNAYADNLILPTTINVSRMDAPESRVKAGPAESTRKLPSTSSRDSSGIPAQSR